MKRGILTVLGFILGVLLFINTTSASLSLGNKSSEINTVYAPSEVLRGWLNISFQNENANSLLTAFDSNISLIDFLDLNGFNCESSSSCSCFPSDCEKGYVSSGSGQSSKQFSLEYWENKLLGIKLTGEVTGIDSEKNLIFNVSTNAGRSCLNPLKIDVLDDGVIEWEVEELSNDTCSMENPYGCWNENNYIAGNEFILTKDKPYCEKVNILFGKGFKIGAEVIGSGSADFEMDIEGDNCPVSISNGGEISCMVETDEEIKEEAEVCISRTDSGTNEYKIKYENVEPCGSTGGVKYDFPIFAYPRKYSSISNLVFNKELSGEIWAYVNNKYKGHCNPECIIPIKFYAGVKQTTTISNLKLYYEKGGTQAETNLYNLTSSNALISSNFLKLDLEKANFLVPSEIGTESLILKLNNNTILEKEISIKNVPKIKDIIPHEVPALVSHLFWILLENDMKNLTYSWNFGDGTETQLTNKTSVYHVYSKLGNYNLTVTVSNKLGNSSKSVSVKVGSPKDYINSTITDYNKKLDNIETEINKLPEWVKKEIEKKFDVDSARSQIKSQESKYDAAFSDTDYVNIMSVLLNLSIPNSFNISQKINPSEILPDPKQINLAALDNFGAGKLDETEEDYTKAVTYWFMKAMEMKIESKTYALYYDDKTEDLLSYVKITLIPKPDQKLGEIYFLVNGNPDEIKFNTDKTVKEYDDASGIIFSELESSEIIEFLYPGKISVGNFPVYVSPEFKNLEIGLEPGICNFNKKCEKDLGETYKNCRSDCKPVGLTILWICILLFVALCIYVALQEWYKRHYEKNLFPDRNQLFNLINFMNISYNQGMKKPDILNKLKDLGWNNEQLRYAWNKFQGKRTGMWEIPIFKWFENKQVKRELEKRGSSNRPPVGI